MAPKRGKRAVGAGAPGGMPWTPPAADLSSFLSDKLPAQAKRPTNTLQLTSTQEPPSAALEPLLRRDAPAVKARKRGNLDAALEAASSNESRQLAIDRYERDTAAASARPSRASVWKTWETVHAKWHGPLVPALPLTPDKIKCVAAALKAGG